MIVKMNILLKTLTENAFLIHNIKNLIKIENVLFAIAFFLLITVLLNLYIYHYKKSRFKIRKNKRRVLREVTRYLKKYRWMEVVIIGTAEKISMFNAYSIERNSEIAVLILAISIALAIFQVFITYLSHTIWYVLLAYSILMCLFIILAFYVYFTFAKMRFTDKLPETFKILNSRYTSKGNILKAIHASLDDLDRTVRKEMLKIYDVLNKNDMEDVKNTFGAIERIYKNEYLTLLLNLIYQAHYKGGNDVIKIQFEQITEEILISIENQRDVEVTSRAYVILALLIPIGMMELERFNYNALGKDAAVFYTSSLGIGLKILLYIAAIFYIGLMLFFEKVS